ncbi:MAG TPA: FtsH protease activity modulator HflK [Alphaproteobacteria bacterium]
MLRRGQDKVRTLLPGGLGGGRGLILLGIAIVVIWLATGFYRVQPNEQGVELVFGKWVSTTGPGLNYNWPAPIGEVLRPAVTTTNRVEVGFRTGGPGRADAIREVPEESLMLTGDENIIDVHAVVFWKVLTTPETVRREVVEDGKPVMKEVEVNGIYDFLFNIRRPEVTVKNAAEAALREIIGKSEFEFARTQGRVQIAEEAQKLIQSILNDYGAGVQILGVQLQKIDPPGNVLDAFRDVQAARADRERAVNEATAYLNEVVQKAQGEAEQIVRAGEAYRAERIARATGEASRFLAVFEQYKNEKDVTKRRIYLDVMQSIMGKIDKVLIDNRLGGSGVLPYLPLEPLTPRSTGTSPSTQGAGGQR